MIGDGKINYCTEKWLGYIGVHVIHGVSIGSLKQQIER